MEYDFPENTFSVWDYVVFAVVLAISASIGLFFACRKKTEHTTKEFLMANRSMSVIPTAMSLLASFMSAITLLGVPAEIYVFGAQYFAIMVGYLLMVPLPAYIFIPIFHKLQLTSVNEYLELRFHRSLRIFGTIIFLLQMISYMAIVLYTPALAFNVVTGINIWLIVCVVGAVCTFYTALGGMKAVMWTDTFQIIMMFTSLLAVVIKGHIDHGGIGNIWQHIVDSGRVNFSFDPNPLIRHTVWNLVFGGALFWTAIYGVNQAQVQRALCVPTVRHAQMAMWLNWVGLEAILVICALCGMVLWAEYRGCDPLNAGRISSRDQLLPQYVMDKLAYPGLPGLFTAGIFSAGLSTISSGLNSLAAVTLTDLIRLSPCTYAKNITEKKATLIVKILPFFYGALMIGFAYFASSLPGVLQGAYVMFGILSGPMLGVFALGMIYPCANTKGAWVGVVSGLLLTMWVGLSALVYKPPVAGIPPRYIDQCPLKNHTSFYTTAMVDVEATTGIISTVEAYTMAEEVSESDMLPGYLDIYSLSYIYLTPFALIVVTVVGLLVSIITGGTNRKELDPRLICPIVDTFCCCLPKSCRRIFWCDVDHDQTEDSDIAKEEMNGKVNSAFNTDVKEPNSDSSKYPNKSNLYPDVTRI